MSQFPNPEDTLLIDNVEALKVYFDPFRLRILGELIAQPRTIHDVASILNVPFTRLYYQFNLLEQYHFIRVVETKAKVGAVEEKLYRISAYQFTISRQFTSIGEDGIPDTIRVILDTTFDEVRRDLERNIRGGVIDVQAIAPHPNALLTKRGYLRLTPDEAVALQHDIFALMKKYSIGDTTADSRDYLFTINFAPTTLTIPDEDEKN
jgi:hypothetical protein